MDKQQALRDLLAMVEAGDGHEIELPFWKVWLPEEEDGRLAYVAAKTYNGSLDAALALHNAVLHESVTKQEIWSKRYGGTVELSQRGHVISQGSDVDNNPARAWLIAILKALIANGETDA